MSQIVSRQPQLNGKDDRADAWVISCDAWDNANRPGLILPLNPESLELKFPVRGQESTMYGGKFVVRKTDPRTNSVFDFPAVTLRFNSGNIQPMFSGDVIGPTQVANTNASAPGFLNTNLRNPAAPTPLPGNARKSNNLYGHYTNALSHKTGKNTTPGMYAGMPHMPVGVQNLYALLSLVNETWIIDTNSSDTGIGGKRYTQLNRVRVSCSNLVFPGLVLYGFLDESGVQWAESADQFNNFDITINLVVTHSNPRMRGIDFSALIASYKSLFTTRNMVAPEYDISYHAYPDPGVCLEPIPEPPKSVASEPPPTWAQRIDRASQTAFGNGREGGALRGALGNGVGLATSAADRYADLAMANVDPGYYAQIQAQRQAAKRDTAIANGTGDAAVVDVNDFAFLGSTG